jgi:hypothetical protein
MYKCDAISNVEFKACTVIGEIFPCFKPTGSFRIEPSISGLLLNYVVMARKHVHDRDMLYKQLPVPSESFQCTAESGRELNLANFATSMLAQSAINDSA